MKLYILQVSIFIQLYAQGNSSLYIVPDPTSRGGFEVHNKEIEITQKVQWITPSLEKKEIEIVDNKFSLSKNKEAFYHLLLLNQTQQDTHYTAKYFYKKFGKPSKISPREIATFYKNGFEFIPVPLPMEHGRYYGSNSYKFQLLYQGETINDSQVTLQTLNNTQQVYFTNKNGEILVTLPNDFSNVKEGLRANKPSYFILEAKLQKNDKNYITTLSQPYYVNPNDYWRSVPYGFILAIIGAILGIFIYRRFKNG